MQCNGYRKNDSTHIKMSSPLELMTKNRHYATQTQQSFGREKGSIYIKAALKQKSSIFLVYHCPLSPFLVRREIFTRPLK